MKKGILSIFLTLILIVGFVNTVSGARPGFGQLYYDGDINLMMEISSWMMFQPMEKDTLK